MKISIRDTDKHAIWAIPDTDLHLADGANDPIIIDYKILTPQQMGMIYVGIVNKVLVAEDAEEFVKLFQPKPKSQPVKLQHKNEPENIIEQSVAEKPKGIVQQVGDRKALNLVSRAEELKRLLKQNVKAVVAQVTTMKYGDIKILLNFEKNNKRRKTVIRTLEFLMKNIEQEVQESISQVDLLAPTTEKLQQKLVHPGVPSNLLSNVEAVVESDQEEILINITGE